MCSIKAPERFATSSDIFLHFRFFIRSIFYTLPLQLGCFTWKISHRQNESGIVCEQKKTLFIGGKIEILTKVLLFRFSFNFQQWKITLKKILIFAFAPESHLSGGELLETFEVGKWLIRLKILLRSLEKVFFEIRMCNNESGILEKKVLNWMIWVVDAHQMSIISGAIFLVRNYLLSMDAFNENVC